MGIFWYDPEEHSFFGVHKKEITPREVEEAAEKGVPFISFGEEFQNDSSNKVGCVVWNADKFEVKVGYWAEPILDELTELIVKEFSLQYFDFVCDEHWTLDTVGTEMV